MAGGLISKKLETWEALLRDRMISEIEFIKDENGQIIEVDFLIDEESVLCISISQNPHLDLVYSNFGEILRSTAYINLPSENLQ